MTTKQDKVGGSLPPALFSGSLAGIVFRLVALAIIDAFAVSLILRLFSDGQSLLALTLIIVTVGLNVIFLVEKLYPFRWLAPGLALMIIMVIYPTVTTVYFAFTNYRTGNLLTEAKALDLILGKPEYRFLPEGEQYYTYTAYGLPENDNQDPLNEENRYLLWLVGRDDGSIIIADQEERVLSLTPELAGVDGVTFDEDGNLSAIEGFEAITAEDLSAALAGRESLRYRHPVGEIRLAELAETETIEASPDLTGYQLDSEQGRLVDFSGRSPTVYDVTAYQNADGEIALWATEVDGRGTLLARPDKPVVIGGQPQTVNDYRILSSGVRVQIAASLAELVFGNPDDPIKVDLQSANRAGRFDQRYVQEDDGRLRDVLTGAMYSAERGTFILESDSIPSDVPDGLEILDRLTPGYFVPIGFDNFERLLTDRRLRGPFLTIFTWTIIHAAVSVVITFSLGLALAILLNSEGIPYRKIFRSLILIPYAIPAFISTVVWRGMYDPNLGLFNDLLRPLGISPSWYGDANAARMAILSIQLWLGFPYMMLICTGALQAIPSDIYEAAEVDGATTWQRFRHMTLPLLLVTVGPLLIASFAFNFNNFTVIELFNQGGPAIPQSSVPAGYTDILITYTYAQAFGTAGGTDYGFASAISIFIFLIVAAITIFNFRFTKAWEEVSENV